MYKNKADLQFAIMQAGDNAAAQVHKNHGAPPQMRR